MRGSLQETHNPELDIIPTNNTNSVYRALYMMLYIAQIMIQNEA